MQIALRAVGRRIAMNNEEYYGLNAETERHKKQNPYNMHKYFNL